MKAIVKGAFSFINCSAYSVIHKEQPTHRGYAREFGVNNFSGLFILLFILIRSSPRYLRDSYEEASGMLIKKMLIINIYSSYIHINDLATFQKFLKLIANVSLR